MSAATLAAQLHNLAFFCVGFVAFKKPEDPACFCC